MQITRIKFLCICFILNFVAIKLNSQQMQRIVHLNGTKTINGIGVTVTKSGKVDSLQYCGDDTGPYYMGYNYNNTGAANGSYTFTFSKPVDQVVLNLAAMSHSAGSYGEEAKVYVNGTHYRFTRLGTTNSCAESYAIITREGDISPCANCSGSGTNGVKINGPINTITVECHIIFGEPMGFVLGIWISGKSPDNNMQSYETSLYESAAGDGKELSITGDMENAIIMIKDSKGNPVTILYKSIDKKEVIINTVEWLSGVYTIEIQQFNKTEKTTIKIP